MPHRSVTRFFVPLIDVLLLLFGVFLLMPIAGERDLEEEKEKVGEQGETVAALQYELRRRTEELEKFEKLRPALTEVEKLKDEIERLKNANRQNLQERSAVAIVDIDGKNGALYVFDPASPGGRLELTDEKAARQYIERERRAAPGREVYFYFLFPRPAAGYPLGSQIERYQAWFAGVANSLQERRP